MDIKFINAVQVGNLVRVRLALSNELMLDPRGKTFMEMLKYAELNLPLLFQEDDGKIYDTNKTNWDEDFLFNLKNGLDLNFSKEKLALYETVIKYVLAEKVKQLESENANSIGADSSKKADNSSSTRDSINKKSVYLGATVAGTAIAITGLCCNKLAITSFGIISAIIGGFLLYNTSKK